MSNFLQTITFGLYKTMKKKQKDNFFTRLLKEDNNLSVLNFFLIAVLAVGILLLFIPVIGMLVDIFYNHTNYELAYTVEYVKRNNSDAVDVVVVIMAGTRENFYEALKRYWS